MKEGLTLEKEPLILVVDDFKATQFMVKKILYKYKYQVIEANNGQEALELFLENSPDVVLMDIEMPVMDGLTACKKLKRLPRGQTTPVLIFTGMEDNTAVQRAFEAGSDDFITKPVNWEELVHRIQRLLHKREMHETIQYQSYYDNLTGLPNRILFKDRLSMALTSAEKEERMLAVIQVNVKGFKYINEAFGYEKGDLLLQGVSKRLKACIFENVTLSRLGGDHFALFLPEIRKGEEVVRLVDSIVESFQIPWIIEGQEIKLNSQIGIALYPENGEDNEMLLMSAEKAMLKAEEPHIYRFYNKKMNSKALERLSLENSLYQALEQGEFILFYQPLVISSSGKIAGVEALLRWKSPKMGLVSPIHFIPLLEETGLILSVGEWVVKEACRQSLLWEKKGIGPLYMGVNLSPLQFLQQDLIGQIERILEETGLEPSRLKLEITESMAMQDIDYTINTLKSLKSMGVRIAIDDFGTGYSSLAHIKQLPFDELKIDGSFIRDLCSDPKDRVIVESILSLGQGLKIRHVAEGVETLAQASFLKKKKCEELQGFLFCKPLHPNELEGLLEKNLREGDLFSIHSSKEEVRETSSFKRA